MACGLAYVPEDRQLHGLIPGMTIMENVTLAVLQKLAKAQLIDRRKEAEHAAAMAEQLEIKAAGLWQRTQELSGGNQQKTVLAKWLGTSPRILILDEPTRGIDVGTKAAVHQLMGELAEKGVAILMISSELPEVIGMSDRILVMCEGRLTGEFSRAGASQERIMQAATRRMAV
jgi:rhamnose transport system ATP-binding protein